MIDIRLIRENPDLVRENIKKKFQDAKLPLVDEVIELDIQNRATKKGNRRGNSGNSLRLFFWAPKSLQKIDILIV